MNILIIDADTATRNVYANILLNAFSLVQIRYLNHGHEIFHEIKNSDNYELPDLLLLDFLTVDRPFEFMEELTSKKLPFIVLSHSADERIIVESMKCGALDFVAKQNIKKGYLKQVVARSLFEIPRWHQMQKALAEGPQYKEREKYNNELRDYARQLQISQIKSNTSIELIPGKSYRLIFQYCTIDSPSNKSMDEQSRVDHINLLLDRLGASIISRGGFVWTRKSDANISIFTEDNLQNAVSAAIEGQSIMTDLASRMYVERPTAMFAMASGQVVYTENKGELISEAINLSAHIANKSKHSAGVMITDQLFHQLAERSKKYFIKQEPLFEGNQLYSFTYQPRLLNNH